jgi:hypothetical protein
MVEDNNWRGTVAWIWEDTRRDYSQTEYGKYALVVGDGDDGENSLVMQRVESDAGFGRDIELDSGG